jgi:hypothetical protein
MEVRIIALTLKGEEALRKYVDNSNNIEYEMLQLSKLNPKRIRFDLEQKASKKFVTEEYFENPFMIVAIIKPKYNNKVGTFVPTLEKSFHKLMLDSNCGKEDYIVEVV